MKNLNSRENVAAYFSDTLLQTKNLKLSMSEIELCTENQSGNIGNGRIETLLIFDESVGIENV